MLRQPATRISPHRKAQLDERACHMRAQMTRSETALWQAIRRSQLGTVFRRQVAIGGNFIADFAAPAVRVVVEVDGAYHIGRAEADARRDRKLERLGWRVVRIPVEVVLGDLPAAVAAARAAIAASRGQRGVFMHEAVDRSESASKPTGDSAVIAARWRRGRTTTTEELGEVVRIHE